MDTQSRLTTFQLVVLIVFGVSLLGGLVVFASYRSFSGDQLGNVVIWGTLEAEAVNSTLLSQGQIDDRLRKVTYVEKSPDTFSSDLSDALAAGTGPDLFFLTQDLILQEQDKITPFGYDSFSQKFFNDTFIDEAGLYLGTDGIKALPVVVDPLVLYWNKDMLSKYNFAEPPEYWDEVFTMAEAISISDSSGRVSQSAIALGEAGNVNHMKEIMSMLIAQASGEVVGVDSSGRLYSALTKNPLSAAEIPAISALRFYTTFANAAESVYSWNRSLPTAHNTFVQGNTGMYVGYASELPLIAQENPNLRFEVAAIPQIRDSRRYVSFGTVYGLAIPRTAPNPSDSAAFASIMMGPDFSAALAREASMAPVRRNLLAQPQEGSARIFNQMALIAYGWFDPNPTATEALFADMVNSITSGSDRLTSAVSRAERVLQTLLQ